MPKKLIKGKRRMQNFRDDLSSQGVSSSWRKVSTNKYLVKWKW